MPTDGVWQGRPPGLPGTVPPPSVPISFLAAASLGLIACGAALIWARGAAPADPTADQVVAAAHLGMLATLSMGVLGALHQFTPVVTGRPLRSVLLARLTFLAWLAAAWVLPLGIAVEQESVVEVGGALAAVAIALLVVNLSSALSTRGKGAPVVGLRFCLAGFVATGCFGVLYVADRRGNWFDLSGHVVLAHAVVGLFAWLGLAYVAVSQKLWPMFFLAHVPGRHRAGQVAVWAVPIGVALLSPGLLAGLVPLAAAGATVLTVGLCAHLVSLLTHLRHRRRSRDLHLTFVVTSAGWLVVGAALALAAAVVLPGHEHVGMDLVAAAVAAFGGWLLEALVGHAYKVVPFIAWSALRAKGISNGPTGKPLLFADLYDHNWAWGTYVTVTGGIASLSAGLGAGLPAMIALGGGLFIATGLVTAANLSVTPARMLSTTPAGQPAGGIAANVPAAS